MEATLPGSVQRQLDQAAAIEAQLYGPPATPPEGNTEDAPEVTAPVEPQAEQPAVDDPAPVPTPAPADEVWEQKFNVLQGKYQAEVPRLHQQVRELTDQLQSVTARLEKAATPPPPPVADAPVFTESDEEKFGSDLLDAMQRVARAESAKAVKDVEKKVTSAVQPVADQVAQTATQRFWDTVDRSVPDFEQINQDPRWFQYLDTRIPGTRVTRRDAANTAIAQGDPASLVELVTHWKQAVTATPSAPAPAPAAPTVAAPNPDLSRQVAPASRRDAAPATPSARVWTGAEYEAAQDPRNAHRMPRAEWEALVAESEKALAEGRIQW